MQRNEKNVKESVIPRFQSEADKLKHLIVKYTEGNGIDVACGGSKLVPHAIAMDQPVGVQYANVGDDDIQLRGDGRDLHWFRDGVLDWLHSSHMLEDYVDKDITPILQEWIRVLKPGGYLLLSLPHEGKFYHHCVVEGKQVYNHAHKCKEMSPEYMKEKCESMGDLELVYLSDVKHIYCFVGVWRKKGD